MTWLHKVRPLLLVLGGLLVIGSLLGARLLAPGAGGGTVEAGQKSALPVATGKEGTGPVVLGYADSDPSPVGYGLPPILQSGEIEKVFVNPGDEVKVRTVRLFGGTLKVGDPLYKFDTTIQEADLKTAERAVDAANAELKAAEGMKDEHAKKVNLQTQAVAVADLKVKLANDAWRLGVTNTRESYKTIGKPQADWDEALSKEPKIFELYSAHELAQKARDVEQAKLESLKSADMDLVVGKAKAEVKRYQSLVQKARSAIDMCTVRAKQAGTIERVSARPGEVMGISTREPAVILVPAGPRVVRAEVEAEFAHRVGQDKIGKRVTIYDNTDPKITYKGIVKRIPNVFLPKRTSEGGFIPNETRVLEAVIEVSDANPPGQPPLRVGQKVRVDFGQP